MFRTRLRISRGRSEIGSRRNPRSSLSPHPGTPHRATGARKYLRAGKIRREYRAAHRGRSAPNLPFPCGVYDASASQRAGHRNHAQQPRHRAGLERFLGLRSRRIRAGPPPLICDERPGARPRGDGHGPLAVSGDEEPGHSGRTPRMRTECPTGNRGIVPHRTRRRERPFPGANPPAAHEESLFSSRGSGEIRSPSTLRELLGRGCAGPLARC